MASKWVPESAGLIPGRETLGPLLLVGLMPLFVILLPYSLTEMDGSLQELILVMRDDGIFSTIYNAWFPWNDIYTWKIIAVFLGLQLAMLKLVPGKKFYAPITPAGNVPVYPANGFQVYCITLVLFCLGAYFGFYKGGVLVDYLGNIVSSMNVFALLFCLFLYFKGKYAPSSSDADSTGNFVFDYYWGTELHARILGWDVKQVSNCRFGMMFWGVFIISALFKQYETYSTISNGLWINVILQFVYITKFFIWETGYFSTYDIMHDRSGFYLVWGCCVYIPAMYCSHTLYLAHRPITLGTPILLTMAVVGVLMTLIQFDMDHQRLRVRRADGKCTVWGKPADIIRATYVTEDGKTKNGLLLANGWNGLARHLHYIPELIMATLWVIPCWTGCLLPYAYPIYLTILLIDRMYRIDARCSRKYGKYWQEYCDKVPYILIPEIF